jgi:hypothetical protein
MPSPLTVSDFKPRQAICEVKYPDAFLVFDKTGDIFHELATRFKNLHNDAATPAQTQMSADEGVVGVELQALRLVDNKPDWKLDRFAANFKTLFDIAAEKLDLKVFTRVGLRQVFIKAYDSFVEAEAALNSPQLLKLGTDRRFGIGPNFAELVIRWEDQELGAILRLKAQTGNVSAQFPSELGMKEETLNKEFHQLLIDIDYYTVALVEREQWDPVTWITQSARIVLKETERILSA